MKTVHKTYRFAAALTLIIFVSNILVPAAISAASLHCGMEMTSSNHHACCVNTGDKNHRTTMVADKSCPMLSFCENSIDDPQSNQPAITQITKIVIAADLTGKLHFLETDNDHPKKFSDESESVDYSPPIFLLNGTFLN